MSERLHQLHKQRALAQEQLAWLDREILAETQRQTAPAPGRILPVANPVAPEKNAEDIIAQYRQDSASVQSEVKRGCLLYFFLAFAVVGLAVLALYAYSTLK